MSRKENWKKGRLLHVGLSCLFFPLSVMPCLFPLRENKLEMWEGLDLYNHELAGKNKKMHRVQTSDILMKDWKEVTHEHDFGLTMLR